MTTISRPRPVLLVIRDGWGERDEIEGNGVKLARKPYDDRWRAECPFTLVRAAAKDVGLASRADGQL
jgi:2,3-bisphosphoglycerate-independent phosphoglycerate mutase